MNGELPWHCFIASPTWRTLEGGGLLKGGRPFSLMPGRTLSAFDAERGLHEDVHLASRGQTPGASWGTGGRSCPPIGVSTMQQRRRRRP